MSEKTLVPPSTRAKLPDDAAIVTLFKYMFSGADKKAEAVDAELFRKMLFAKLAEP